MTPAFNQHTLEKLEELYKQLGFKIRFEKGNFRTGACTLDSSRVIVVNKFANLESRIVSLISLSRELTFNEELLDQKSKQFLYSLKQIELEL